MEARTFAKANQHKSDQIAADIAEFEKRGGKIQVLPTKGDAVIGFVPVDPFNNRAKTATKKKAKSAELDDDINDSIDDDTAPSKETPAEQLDIEVE
jgi:hypothetical protein